MDEVVLRLDADDPRWSQWLGHCPHDFYQWPGYTAIEAKRLGGTAVAYAFGHGDERALLPLVLREVPGHTGWFDGMSGNGYAGPVFSSAEAAPRALAAIAGTMAEDGVTAVYARLHTLLPQPLEAMGEHGRVVEHGPTVWIDLRQSEPEQWAGYRPVHRNLVRRALRSGYVATMDPKWSRFDDFWEIYAETMDGLGANWGRDYLLGLKEALGPRGMLCMVDHEGEPACGAVFTVCGGIVQYHLSGTRASRRKDSPNRLMLDHVRRWATEQGHWALHLGGGVGAREDALFRFKAGCSKLRAVCRSWQLTPAQERYDALVREWEERSGVSVSEAGGFFPAYRRNISG